MQTCYTHKLWRHVISWTFALINDRDFQLCLRYDFDTRQTGRNNNVCCLQIGFQHVQKCGNKKEIVSFLKTLYFNAMTSATRFSQIIPRASVQWKSFKNIVTHVKENLNHFICGLTTKAYRWMAWLEMFVLLTTGKLSWEIDEVRRCLIKGDIKSQPSITLKRTWIDVSALRLQCVQSCNLTICTGKKMEKINLTTWSLSYTCNRFHSIISNCGPCWTHDFEQSVHYMIVKIFHHFKCLAN